MTTECHHKDAETPLLKRTKRNVIGRGHTFFVATSPGFERLCLDELRTLLPTAETAVIVSGGVEFGGRLTDCYVANLYLHAANRILMRLDSFKATNFRELEKRISRFPWELYLEAGVGVRFNVTTRRTRLRHTKAISERFQTGIADRFAEVDLCQNSETHPNMVQQIFVRAADDRFTVSMDSSGDHLHKRGILTHRGRAPIRETIAAGVLKLAGHIPGEPLIDPMCGSGTFSLEAAMMVKQIPAGWFREFAFMGWPAFRLNQWNYIKHQAEIQFRQMDRPVIFSSDKNRAIVNKFESCIRPYGLTDAITVCCKDFFNVSPADLTDRSGLVVINPPYGHRIGSRQGSKSLLDSICQKLKDDYRGWKFALITPDKDLEKRCELSALSHPLYHGGLKLRLLTGIIQ